MGNSLWLVTGEFPPQRPVTRSFDIFFDVGLNKRLGKPSKRWWFETHRAHYDVTVRNCDHLSTLGALHQNVCCCITEAVLWTISQSINGDMGSRTLLWLIMSHRANKPTQIRVCVYLYYCTIESHLKHDSIQRFVPHNTTMAVAVHDRVRWKIRVRFRTWIRQPIPCPAREQCMMTSSDGTIFHGPFVSGSTGHRCIPLTKASDTELWCFLWSTPEQ